ncbi:nicotinate-nucleotide adenylyltransferase [Planococcus halotolerans]|uniref:Probable nicotinate-nucleotide adenylyltransferase n=1 Tax=Planococcus halotolerans TaxID=2233542 RepID=A0A365KTV1_9BACL|nr:nicotinate-nucleotide adenylyltransferase [Planococcus halotolerans]QHJ71529.1 nicotinate-nucleotide adenylyltransferase [Planococcus halotolerans]RAZ76616.1 nicotinate-nucleotide adenylyltransferase [Planococcus halotolerans]
MKKVGILGGTFNPPHFGHLIMANEAYHSLGLEEVRFMPNAAAPHKEVHGADTAQRLKMTELAIEDFPQFRIEDYEIKTGGVSYTYNTIRQLVEQESDKEFYFIIGGDSVAQLNSWHRIHELADLIQFVGIGRPGYDSATDFPVMMIDSPEMHLSSTMLRERVAANRPLTFFVPEKVEAYIRKEGLYGPEQDASTR